ncbi:adenylosuccinate lyase [Caloramator proteoclasticus]|uniref:Adenylosuccinate lyase n=1 Tax=Caloramator proteoclasticus DSM 10124 TaxID=1121262 RepID=A0A1M4SQ02_9CLOT|nr:adenylosuccinate lyase [Caloramator proteoclasticus]SHE34278.1 adenylosuccinate lyase [Caloramator proteoclasticus DSM 10124]
MDERQLYISPLTKRYASKEMSYLFSDEKKFKTWRKLWVVLAEAEKELGLSITQEQIDELKANIDNLNYEVAEQKERENRHDVMSHVYAYGEQCPKAKPIIHLGATSCYVGDNTDVIIMKEALEFIKKKLIACIKNLKEFALQYKGLPTLSYTHLQPAQLSTVGKRACLWLQDLVMDLEQIEYCIENLKLLGVKGTTGTQASFLKLFNGDHNKVKQLDEIVCKKLGFDKKYFKVTGQTYPRKQDVFVLNVLSSIAQSAYKFSNDIRILQSFKEIEEPFEKNQIGSSAMPYKRNPMRSERISALARYVIVNSTNADITASTQWFERTLDDSANRRLVLAESFLAVDGILNLYINVTSNLVVNEKIILKRVREELPFMATENILMECVKKGGDRQELHERIRVHSMDASKNIKTYGGENDLLERIINDPVFNLDKDDLDDIMNENNYIGRSKEQVDEFICEVVEPIIKKYENIEKIEAEITV